MQKQEKIFKALSDKNRLRILKMLQKKSLCVCEITEILKLAASTVSQHLSILSDAGLITGDKDGKWINYRLNLQPEDNSITSALLYVQMILENDEIIKNDLNMISDIDRNKLCCR
ncbi:MAG: winged helix-turn-helix transcriptional regulator [Ignavibacteria bacterium]|nr:winged helix-turn-helix transcriptional regulator [Ignavibacteria bacterium]